MPYIMPIGVQDFLHGWQSALQTGSGQIVNTQKRAGAKPACFFTKEKYEKYTFSNSQVLSQRPLHCPRRGQWIAFQYRPHDLRYFRRLPRKARQRSDRKMAGHLREGRHRGSPRRAARAGRSGHALRAGRLRSDGVQELRPD